MFALAKDQEPRTGEAYAFYSENDSRSMGGPGSDQAYTNGIKFSYIYAQDIIPRWTQVTPEQLRFFDTSIQNPRVNFALSLGQQIFTPNNTGAKELIIRDRPYAAWLYLGFSASLKEKAIEHFLELDLGIVGPSALGQQTQNKFHELISIPQAQGWSNGLNDEPTVQLFYQKRFKYLHSENFDLTPYYGAALGNVQIAAHCGGIARYGWQLPDNFGPSRPSASDGNSFISSTENENRRKNSYYIFAGARANAFARNIFLDGNTFQSSHRVKKYPFTFEGEFGFGLQVRKLNLAWSFVTRSPEFEERSMTSHFAALSMVYAL